MFYKKKLLGVRRRIKIQKTLVSNKRIKKGPRLAYWKYQIVLERGCLGSEFQTLLFSHQDPANKNTYIHTAKHKDHEIVRNKCLVALHNFFTGMCSSKAIRVVDLGGFILKWHHQLYEEEEEDGPLLLPCLLPHRLRKQMTLHR